MGSEDVTYVIFDGDKDYWAYARMKGWSALPNVDFNFTNVHDHKSIREWSQPNTVRRTLSERFRHTDQVIVLIGELTRSHHRFVRWELVEALERDLPMIAVNLNGMRGIDHDLCPPVLRTKYVVHIPFRMKIIKYALDKFPDEYYARGNARNGARDYPNEVYERLGLDEYVD